MKRIDVIVVGAGHAGCEAALSASRMGCETLLFNINLDSIALMSCNPAIGGLAKGQLVKEIDALGGQMGKIADETAVHFRVLNASKGPAVQSTRVQCDKQLYRLAMKAVVEKQKNLHLRQAVVDGIIVEDGRVSGVVDSTGFFYGGRTVVVTTGTFLHGLIHIGTYQTPAGRAGEIASIKLADCLKSLGFEIGRMKTGTPPRLRSSTIDFSRLERQDSVPDPRPFSYTTPKLREERLPSFFSRTTEETHRLIRENIGLSPLYSGVIKGVSARYCPSLEDKVMRFSEKGHHPVTLEFEGLDTEEVYAKGLGNCLPLELQERIVRSVLGLEQAEIMRSAYAIEYDFVQPTQLKPTLETKPVRGLFLAGQINGTSGYEEAAAQGLWAGINAALQVQGREPFTLGRSQAYMGVMVDDLITRGVDEPYRMFTSRAEYRLILREDNAVFRLMDKGHEFGLIPDQDYRGMMERTRQIDQGIGRLSSLTLKPTAEVNGILSGMGSLPIRKPMTLFQLLKRPEMVYDSLRVFEGWSPIADDDVKRQIEIEAKYEDYIRRQRESVEKFMELEHKKIPPDMDYGVVPGLSNELKHKLQKIQPSSIGQARRISGMTQAALAAILIFLKKMELERETG
ncbi:MAG TPA: tRNA uridine-5-carboxymethylaminomethyl(34) synthesis enzyme MnmG [Syntrophales bacterium]|nr:tRNA uridine-5-carboxymethylaminomethyl(34) synthesis enzyme MnmG [Syntrophales bacterium]HOX95075.1 tRNA uridine-5-carboxymethylaminomethyl(34) synthesis enzyme MnmG [Syntrophales bacterium]HPI55764.1 tRNA uridine-5-carboxymethylaminomethyl(34) synthesis enzyme MnmG [Syntrophales bacterium]HPN23744.1 tRNA uridine-5-carboxymethylaminomethyl(34) synthesis enzyme MnmG [Syntrophales bacterium]HQM27730.1 tRNA uridine-5-carboxymethylaminomethyl(34) synthesis enzyme MnmG [Syntrophales bacterium]